MHKVLLAATAAAHVTFGAAVQAATVDPSDPLGLLKSFNTIALGDLNASSETQGTVFVGGDLHSNGYTVSPDSEPEVITRRRDWIADRRRKCRRRFRERERWQRPGGRQWHSQRERQ